MIKQVKTMTTTYKAENSLLLKTKFHTLFGVNLVKKTDTTTQNTFLNVNVTLMNG